MNNALHIIHLSDLHIDPKQEEESKPVFRSLCQKIKKARDDKGIEFDLLIVSGDLVNQGAKDYQPVLKRLEEIMEAAALSCKQVFIVPGNHDIVRSNCDSYHCKAIIRSLKTTPRELRELDENTKKMLFAGFEAYLKFAKKFPLSQQGNFGFPGFSQADLNISGIPIRLCGFNTALVAGPDDQGKTDEQLKDRVLGCSILWKMLDLGEQSEEKLKLVVSHYPLSWIHHDEKQEVTERLQRTGAILFHGHVHEPTQDIRGITSGSKLLLIGAGSLYGQKWLGRNHCQILELNLENTFPLLHEWFWFGKYGWRGFEPIEIDWSVWEHWRKHFLVPQSKEANFSEMCKEVGLIHIGNNRKQVERNAFIQKILDTVAEGTELIAVGRSLIDWAPLYKDIESAIRDKKLHVKLAILDENSLPNKNNLPDNNKNKSWIEKPISVDWAMKDVVNSMEHFRRIKVTPNTGSLQIYGLPFYTSHSFVAYTEQVDNQRYCLEEVGMALERESRPFIELTSLSPDSYASSLEWMYKNFMTEDRLLLSNNGKELLEKNTAQRSKIIASKVEDFGLVDIAVDRTNIDWFGHCAIPKLIENTPKNGGIFIVGRSLVAWTTHYMQLADAIIDKCLKCTFVIADPTLPNLKSLVLDDYAQNDLPTCWEHFHKNLYPRLKKRNRKNMGSFELYGIPTYVPTTFASYMGKDGVEFCNLEVGIGVTPSERVILYFKHVGEKDIYSTLNKIYRGMLRDRKPLLKFPE